MIYQTQSLLNLSEHGFNKVQDVLNGTFYFEPCPVIRACLFGHMEDLFTEGLCYVSLLS